MAGAAPMTQPSGQRVEADRLRSLEAGLRAELGERVRSDLGERSLYASDASNFREVPGLVVAPASLAELETVVALCGEVGVPLTMRGAGTSIAGNALGPGVLVSTRSLARVLELDPEARTAVVEPGVVLDDLDRLAGSHGLRFGPDPSTHSRCTLGGMISNNACGSHSVRWGTTAQNLLGMDVIRSDGSRVRLPSPESAGSPEIGASPPNEPVWPPLRGELSKSLGRLVDANEQLIRDELPAWPRRVSGYALDWLLPERGRDMARALVGTEGTCAVIAQATLRLVRTPRARCLLVLGFADDIEGADAVPELLKAEPFTVESLSAELLGLADARPDDVGLPEGGAWLLVEAGADDPAAAHDHAARLAAAVGRPLDHADVRLVEDAATQAAIWRIREDGAGHSARLPDGGPAWPGFEDAAVPPPKLAGYLRELRALLQDHDLQGVTYGHYGEGCIHLRVGFGLDRVGGAQRYERFMTEAADLVVRHEGTLSGEHGDGRMRGPLLDRMFSPELRAVFERFKDIWDPAGVLNPNVIVQPPGITEGLRATTPVALQVRPDLAFAHDRGDVRAAVDRCIGVGRCVSTQGAALMCPSYRATRDEQHSTRGRARLLQEMIVGGLAEDGWRSEAVRESLDLCLSCKGCVSACPTGVDMASYKSEFLQQHYRGRLRPRSHYSLGWLPLWLRLGERLPRVVNFVTGSRLTRRLFAYAAGIASERSIPPLARRSFRRSHRASQRISTTKPPSTSRRPVTSRGRVVLWPDTFNDHLSPEVAQAALRVLDAAGFEAIVPRQSVCCGLTLFTTGQLDIARRVARRALGAPELGGDDPVLVLEPSCAAMLRTDLLELLPRDPRAASLARRVTTLAELLDEADFRLPDAAETTALPALSQPHCHQQAVLGLDADRRVLARSGIKIDTELEGCCGLAGNFGAERGHESISRAVAELSLLPALEAADPDAPLLADGFSCRTQIEALSGRRARHLAEILADRLPSDHEPATTSASPARSQVT